MSDNFSRLDWSADFRFRLETDWNSTTKGGLKRSDRDRARIRARFGLTYDLTPHWILGARLRTGSDASQQSPHITLVDFDGNDVGDRDLNFDRWYLKGSFDRGSLWLGRNTYPFWKRNDLFWTDDVTPIGMALQRIAGGVQLTGGYFLLPAGMDDTVGDGMGLQIVRHGDPWTVAISLHALRGDSKDPDHSLLLQGNGHRDYTLLQTSLYREISAFGSTLTLGFDYSHNFEHYGAEDAFAYSQRNEVDAYVGSVSYGSLNKPGDTLLGYYFAHIEQFAIHNSFSQDDWMRWGSATQIRSSDFRGHEFRLAHQFDGFDITARLYHANSLTSTEDGNRLRVDFNWRW